MRTALTAIGCLLLVGCPREQALTADEARQSLEEVSFATQAEGFAGGAVDISTHFTIGQGVAQAAEELRAFVVSQLPCAEVTRSAGTLTVEYGVNPGSCTYRGHTFSGTTSVTVERNDTTGVRVQHVWDRLSNGRVEVSGQADVTWNFDEQTRHVVHAGTWTNLATGHEAEGSGDRTQTVLEDGLVEGIQVDGSRSWSTDRGEWDLAIDGVQMRWIDPVPQAGTYTLRTPFDKTASMDFDRVDADTIRVTVKSGQRSFDFTVSSLGAIQSES